MTRHEQDLIPVTSQASGSGIMLTVPSHGAIWSEHVVAVPVSACPVSRNPVSGSARISYRPAGRGPLGLAYGTDCRLDPDGHPIAWRRGVFS